MHVNTYTWNKQNWNVYILQWPYCTLVPSTAGSLPQKLRWSPLGWLTRSVTWITNTGYSPIPNEQITLCSSTFLTYAGSTIHVKHTDLYLIHAPSVLGSPDQSKFLHKLHTVATSLHHIQVHKYKSLAHGAQEDRAGWPNHVFRCTLVLGSAGPPTQDSTLVTTSSVTKQRNLNHIHTNDLWTKPTTSTAYLAQ